MPSKRVPLHRGVKPRITPELLHLWRTINEILAGSGAGRWEEDGGQRREYLDAICALNKGLGLFWGDWSPADVGDEPPAYLVHNSHQSQCWHKAKRLRLLLIEAERQAEVEAVAK